MSYAHFFHIKFFLTSKIIDEFYTITKQNVHNSKSIKNAYCLYNFYYSSSFVRISLVLIIFTY